MKSVENKRSFKPVTKDDYVSTYHNSDKITIEFDDHYRTEYIRNKDFSENNIYSRLDSEYDNKRRCVIYINRVIYFSDLFLDEKSDSKFGIAYTFDRSEEPIQCDNSSCVFSDLNNKFNLQEFNLTIHIETIEYAVVDDVFEIKKFNETMVPDFVVPFKSYPYLINDTEQFFVKVITSYFNENCKNRGIEV